MAGTMAAVGGFLSTYGSTIAGVAGAAGAVGSALMASKANKAGPQLDTLSNKEVTPNNEAALRNAQDMARRRKGVAANILTDGSGNTSGAVASKTLLGQ